MGAKWGLDGKAQDVLCRLDPFSRQRVMEDFNPPDLAKASQMLMGFVKGVVARNDARGQQQAQESWMPVGNLGGVAVGTGDSTVDSFIVRWGLDAKAQDVLCKLDRDT